jgi:hypothetical protein
MQHLELGLNTLVPKTPKCLESQNRYLIGTRWKNNHIKVKKKREVEGYE